MHTDLKKKCANCNEWKEASTEHYYQNSSHGRKHTREGRPYLRSICKECSRKVARQRNTEERKIRSQAEKKRHAEVKAARHAAYQKLAKKYEADFQFIYARELSDRNIRLTRYKGIQIKK